MQEKSKRSVVFAVVAVVAVGSTIASTGMGRRSRGRFAEARASVLAEERLHARIDECVRAAAKPQGLAKQVTVGPSVCRMAVRVVESGRRLDQLKARAGTSTYRCGTRMARMPVTL